MATARKPTPVEVEAEESPNVTFEYDGDEYTVEKEKLEDLDVLEAFEKEKLLTPIRLILGEYQWDVFRKRHSSATHLGELAEIMYKHLGVDLGE